MIADFADKTLFTSPKPALVCVHLREKQIIMSAIKKRNLRVQQVLVVVSVMLFMLKITAFYLTNSVAILTDALESIVNVIAGFIGLYSLYISAKPRDADHPYGHGKVEFLSAGIEGTLVIVAGFVILYEAGYHLTSPQEIQQIDDGILLILITAILNYVVGEYCVRTGKKNNSLALIASGTHLKSDTYTTIGLVIGLVLLYFTQIKWLDSAVAILFAFVIIRTGYHILRQSVSGIMDEADEALIAQIITEMQKHRTENLIDIHHLRVVNYAGLFHIDCHITVPWFLNVNQAHAEIDVITSTLTAHFQGNVEFSIHTDGCLSAQCGLCHKQNCVERKSLFVKQMTWTVENVTQNQKHKLS